MTTVGTGCPFKTLGLSLDASASAVESAWRKRSRDCHPDKRPGDPLAGAKFQALTNAKNYLLDPDSKRKAVCEAKAAAASSAAVRKATQASAKAKTGPFEGGAFRASTKANKSSVRPGKAGSQRQAPSPGDVPPKPGDCQGSAGKGFGSKAEWDARHCPCGPVKSSAERAQDIFFRHVERRLGRRLWKGTPAPTAFAAPPGHQNFFSNEARKSQNIDRARRNAHKQSADGVGVVGKRRKLNEVFRSASADLKGKRQARAGKSPDWSCAGLRHGDDQFTGTSKAQFFVSKEKQSLSADAPSASQLGDGKINRSDALRTKSASKVETCPPFAHVIPATTSDVVVATGASIEDARIITLALSRLRSRGGKGPITALSKRPSRAHSVLAKYPRLFDTYLPGSGRASSGATGKWEMHVRLRGVDFDTSVESHNRRRAGSWKFWASASRVATATAVHGEVIEIDESSDSQDRAGRVGQLAKRIRPAWRRRHDLRISSTFNQKPELSPVFSEKAKTNPVKLVIDKTPMNHADQSQSGGRIVQRRPPEDGRVLTTIGKPRSKSRLEAAFSHASGAWSLDATAKRCFYLLQEFALEHLRPGSKGPTLFSYDFASKVLYEYSPQTGSCHPLWVPSAPAVNAAIWTVIPLPPQLMTAQESTLFGGLDKNGCRGEGGQDFPNTELHATENNVGPSALLSQIDELIDNAMNAASCTQRCA